MGMKTFLRSMFRDGQEGGTKEAAAMEDAGETDAAAGDASLLPGLSEESRRVLLEILDKTYGDLAFAVRDANLPEEVISGYTEGMLLREPGFTDASVRVGGLATNCRFGILSNHMKDLSGFDLEGRGMCVATAGSRFKVLARHVRDGKTLILLLHLPDDGWNVFRNAVVRGLDDDLNRRCLEEFEKHCVMAPIPELDTEEWRERCAHPVGMDDSGEFFALDDSPSGLRAFSKMVEMADTMLGQIDDPDWANNAMLLLANWIEDKGLKILDEDDLHRLLTVGAIIARNQPPRGDASDGEANEAG
jgi:hypothetical protein